MKHLDISISPYLNYIAQFKVMDRQEEKEVAPKAQNGDKEARKKLIITNLRFVVSISKKYSNSGIPLIDIISEGNVGLLKAVDKFDTTKDIRFITYAIFWIKQSIIQAIAEKSKLVKLPLSWNNALAYINRNNINESILKDREKFDRLSQELKINEENFKHLLRLSQKAISLEDKIQRNNDHGSEIITTIENKQVVNPEQALLDGSVNHDLGKILSYLTPMEQDIITLRFGLFNRGAPKTLAEIGKIKNLTKERIRQIEKIALEKMKEKLEDNQHLNYLIA